MTNIIVLKNVSKSYPLYPHKWVVDKLDLEIREGEFFCLIGPSGCGKSTLLKLIIGLELPTSGSVVKPENIGMVFQSGALLPWLTVEDNVAFGLKMQNYPEAKIKEAVSKYLAMVNLTEFKRKYPRELSGGQKQRVGIARALCIEPKVLLMDEPFSALDPTTTDELHEDVLQIWRKTQITIIMVSHLIEEAVFLADRIGIMASGKLKDIIEVTLLRPRNRQDPKFDHDIAKIRKLL